MSLLGWVLGRVTAHVVTSEPVKNTIDNALENASEKLEESAKKSRDKLFEKEPGTEILVFDRHSSTASHKSTESLIDRFAIYGDSQELKYTVRGKYLSKKRQLDVFDVNGKSIGLLKENMFAFRGLISFEASPVDFTVEIHGKKFGKIKSKGGIVNRKFEIGFNNWRIKGNVFSGNYSVVKGKDEIARISRKWGTYVLTFFEKQNELVLLMIVIALYSDSAPDKSDIRKRNRERRIRKAKFWFGK